MTNLINFDKGTYLQLKAAYKVAVQEGQDTFTFNDLLFVTDYAKYLLEYLAEKFNDDGGARA